MKVPPPRVLLVDDNDDVRRASELLLMACGYDVVASVSDGISALATVAAAKPDLVVTDLQMPGINGLALLRSLRERPETSVLPVALYTASGEIGFEDLTVFRRATLIRKPASMRVIRAAIDELLWEAALTGTPAVRAQSGAQVA